eukprot:5121779-Pyramimonas_sp.AAC.1
MVAHKLTRIGKKYVPRHFRSPTPSTASSLPTAYLTIKGKCVDENGDLCCERQHAHHREIVSNVKCPRKPFLRLAARGLRLVK